MEYGPVSGVGGAGQGGVRIVEPVERGQRPGRVAGQPDPGGAVASGRRFGAGLGVAHRSGKSRMTGAR
jgi:hypothetical protein